MRSDKDFDTWFLLRLAEFVLRCRGVDFKWRNSASVLGENENELGKIDRNVARSVNINSYERLSVFDGGGKNSDGGGKVDVC